MKKKILTAALAVTLSLGSFCRVNAAQSIPVYYNDWNMPITAYLQNGTTYVPIRRFFELLGGSWVTWDPEARSATVHGNASATFYLDSSRAYYGGASQTVTGTSHLRDSTMYVPLRALAAAMDRGISFDGTQMQVKVDSTVPYGSDTDLYWLSRIIHAESGGEPYAGKVAVGNVILNRVESNDFPNSIYGVIFDRKNGVQFTPAANGTIYNTPSAESIRAARACLAGESTAGSALYFFNPQTATKAGWIKKNCRFYKSIGNHDFYLAK